MAIVKAVLTYRSLKVGVIPAFDKLVLYASRQVVRDGWETPILALQPTTEKVGGYTAWIGTAEISDSHAGQVSYFGHLIHKASKVWLVLEPTRERQ